METEKLPQANVNINNLSDFNLCDIFSELPTEDVLQLNQVCSRWASQLPFVCRHRHHLFLFDTESSNVLQYIYQSYGITFDMFHSHRISFSNHMNNYCEQFTHTMLTLFTNLDYLELSVICKKNFNCTLQFVLSLLNGWAHRLISLKLFVTVNLSQTSITCIHQFWHKLISSLNTDFHFPLLKHLTIYNSCSAFEEINELFIFTNMPTLQEFYYGLQSAISPHLHARNIIRQINEINNLKKFAILFDIIDVDPNDNLEHQLDFLEITTSSHIIELTLLYSHYLSNVGTYFFTLTTKFSNLHYLHLNLRHMRIHFDDLIIGLENLKSLLQLRLSNVPNTYFTKFMVSHLTEWKEIYPDRDVPLLVSVRIFQFSYLEWNSMDNNWSHRFQFEQFCNLFLSIFPRLHQIVHSNIRAYMGENSDNNLFMKPEVEEYFQTICKVHSALSMPPSNIIANLKTTAYKIEPCPYYRDLAIFNQPTSSYPNLSNLTFLDTSALLIPFIQLVSLLMETTKLKYLYIQISFDYFDFNKSFNPTH